MTNGEPIVIRGAVKPISTLARPLPTADLITGTEVEKAHYERSDISVVPAAGVIGEAMVMLTPRRSSCSRKPAATRWPRSSDNLHRYQERIARTRPAPAPGARDGGHIAPGGRDAARGAG